MRYYEFAPHPLLDSYIESYWCFENGLSKPPSFEIIPDGCFDLIISLEDGSITNSRMTGIWNKTVTISQNFPSTVAIWFKPLALQALLDIRIQELLNTSTLLDLKEWNLSKQIIEDNFDNKLLIKNYLDQTFLALLQNKQLDHKLKAFFDLTSQCHGILPIANIATQIGLSTRQIHRKVNELIGISPKEYAKIIRFKQSLKMIREDKSNYIGYFDQAHFIKEFKHYTGYTPNQMDKIRDVRFLQYCNPENDFLCANF